MRKMSLSVGYHPDRINAPYPSVELRSSQINNSIVLSAAISSETNLSD